jgi:hypothetical protein
MTYRGCIVGCLPCTPLLASCLIGQAISDTHTFLRDKFANWTSNGRCVEEALNQFKAILCEGIERFVPHKILRNNAF